MDEKVLKIRTNDFEIHPVGTFARIDTLEKELRVEKTMRKRAEEEFRDADELLTTIKKSIDWARR